MSNSNWKKLSWHLNQYGVSNDLLEDLMKFLSHDTDFLGVFTIADLMKSKCYKKRRFIFILNIGMHFVCLYAQENFVYYIDSFGEKPDSPPVKKFLKQCKRNVYYNRRQIQDFSSAYCGLYACLFALFFGKANMTVNILHFKNVNLKYNDVLCLKYIKKFI